MTAWMMSCRTLSVMEVGTSTWRQITGSVSCSSMRRVAISLKLLDPVFFLGELTPPVSQIGYSNSGGEAQGGLGFCDLCRGGPGRGAKPVDRRRSTVRFGSTYT